jgi:hypothetical protein
VFIGCAGRWNDGGNERVRAAVLGNAGTLMVFRVSAADAELLAPEFPPLPAPELADQAPFRAWLKRTNTDCRPISLHPPLYASGKKSKRVIAQSRRNFGRPRAVIEKTFQTKKKQRNLAAPDCL